MTSGPCFDREHGCATTRQITGLLWLTEGAAEFCNLFQHLALRPGGVDVDSQGNGRCEQGVLVGLTLVPW